jgi:hypothetical protein
VGFRETRSAYVGSDGQQGRIGRRPVQRKNHLADGHIGSYTGAMGDVKIIPIRFPAELAERIDRVGMAKSDGLIPFSTLVKHLLEAEYELKLRRRPRKPKAE